MKPEAYVCKHKYMHYANSPCAERNCLVQSEATLRMILRGLNWNVSLTAFKMRALKGCQMNFALIGAELPGLDVHANYQRTSELRLILAEMGLSFVGVQNISSNKKFQLFLVSNSDERTMVSLAKKFGQKAVLISDEGKNTEVVSTKSNERKALGTLTQVDKAQAATAKFYITFKDEGKDYYYVTKRKV